jgi:hypothetical protein
MQQKTGSAKTQSVSLNGLNKPCFTSVKKAGYGPLFCGRKAKTAECPGQRDGAVVRADVVPHDMLAGQRRLTDANAIRVTPNSSPHAQRTSTNKAEPLPWVSARYKCLATANITGHTNDRQIILRTPC